MAKIDWTHLYYLGGFGGFYVTADHGQAVRRAKLKSSQRSHSSREPKKTNKHKRGKKKHSTPNGPFSPAIVKYMIDRQELRQQFKYKCFHIGQYEDWIHYVQLSRNGENDHDYDIVEGPFDSTAGKGRLRKPRGHQIGLFSQAAKDYFEDHCISIPHQLPAASSESLLTSMQSISIS